MKIDKENWETVELGTLLSLSKNITTVEGNENYVQIGIRLWGLGAYARESVSGTQTQYKFFYKAKEGNFTFNKIWARNGAVTVIQKELENYFVSPEFPVYEVDSNKLTSNWLVYITKSKWFWEKCNEKAFGTSGKNRIKPNELLSIEIPLPTVSEQYRIAKNIDNLKSKIDEVKRLREEQDKLKQYIRYSFMVDCEKKYETKTIGELCKIKKGSFSIMKTEMGKYPLVVTGEKRKSSNDYDFDCEAVCIPLVSSTGHGNAALNRVHYEKGQFALANIICALIVKEPENTSTKYLYELFMAMKDLYLVPLMQGSANVTLSMDKIASVNVPLPPLAEQERIVKILVLYPMIFIKY
jgi:restriction endonuclease S subunit